MKPNFLHFFIAFSKFSAYYFFWGVFSLFNQTINEVIECLSRMNLISRWINVSFDLISIGIQSFHPIFVLVNMLIVYISFNKIFINSKNLSNISYILSEDKILLILLLNKIHIINTLDFYLKSFIVAGIHVNKKSSCQLKVLISSVLNQ